MSKIGRNAPCWCDSGKKYKKCHLNRESEKPAELWKINKAVKRAYAKRLCSCPTELKKNCKGTIIKAHTVSKSSSLKRISRDNHVYGVVPDLFKMVKSHGRFEPELIGINKASTFTGFCAEHDKTLFSPFENRPFNLEKEQIFLIGYRALSRELFTKNAQKKNRNLIQEFDRGKSPSEQAKIQKFSRGYSETLSVSEREINYHKEQYDKILISGSYELVNSYVVEFNEIIPIQCSGTLYPVIDFKGRKLQDLSVLDKIPDLISFSILTEGGKSFAIFSWLQDSHEACSKLMNSFLELNGKEQVSAVFKFSFSFENMFISPKWWELLAEETRTYIVDALQPLSALPALSMSYADKVEMNFFRCSIQNIKNI